MLTESLIGIQKLSRIEILEEQIAHLQKVSDELSDVVSGQVAEIERLTRRVQMLMQREAERELDEGGGAQITDQQPPHW